MSNCRQSYIIKKFKKVVSLIVLATFLSTSFSSFGVMAQSIEEGAPLVSDLPEVADVQPQVEDTPIVRSDGVADLNERTIKASSIQSPSLNNNSQVTVHHLEAGDNRNVPDNPAVFYYLYNTFGPINEGGSLELKKFVLDLSNMIPSEWATFIEPVNRPQLCQGDSCSGDLVDYDPVLNSSDITQTIDTWLTYPQYAYFQFDFKIPADLSLDRDNQLVSSAMNIDYFNGTEDGTFNHNPVNIIFHRPAQVLSLRYTNLTDPGEEITDGDQIRVYFDINNQGTGRVPHFDIRWQAIGALPNIISDGLWGEGRSQAGNNPGYTAPPSDYQSSHTFSYDLTASESNGNVITVTANLFSYYDQAYGLSENTENWLGLDGTTSVSLDIPVGDSSTGFMAVSSNITDGCWEITELPSEPTCGIDQVQYELSVGEYNISCLDVDGYAHISPMTVPIVEGETTTVLCDYQAQDIAIYKYVNDATVAPLSDLFYTVEVVNEGDVAIKDFIIVDDYDQDKIEITDFDGDSDDGDTLKWFINEVAAGESLVFSYQAKLKEGVGVDQEEFINNIAEIREVNYNETNTDNNRAELIVAVDNVYASSESKRVLNIRTGIEAQIVEAKTGDELKYTLNFTADDTDIENYVFRDDLSDVISGVEFISYGEIEGKSCELIDTELICPAVDIPAHTSIDLSFNVRVIDPKNCDDLQLENTFGQDNIIVNLICPSPPDLTDLVLTASLDNNEVSLGDPVNVILDYQNISMITAENVQITVDYPAEFFDLVFADNAETETGAIIFNIRDLVAGSGSDVSYQLIVTKDTQLDTVLTNQISSTISDIDLSNNQVELPIILNPSSGDTGTINVSTNNLQSAFVITGQNTGQIYTGSGISATFENVPTDTYQIVFRYINGFNTPALESQTLVAGDLISFTGIYTIIPVTPPSRGRGGGGRTIPVTGIMNEVLLKEVSVNGSEFRATSDESSSIFLDPNKNYRLTYRITLNNDGPLSARKVRISDSFTNPENWQVSRVKNILGADYDENEKMFIVEKVIAGKAYSFTYDIDIKTGIKKGVLLINTAILEDFKTNIVENIDHTKVLGLGEGSAIYLRVGREEVVDTVSGIKIRKITDKNKVKPGDRVETRIIVENKSGQDLSDFRLIESYNTESLSPLTITIGQDNGRGQIVWDKAFFKNNQVLEYRYASIVKSKANVLEHFKTVARVFVREIDTSNLIAQANYRVMAIDNGGVIGPSILPRTGVSRIPFVGYLFIITALSYLVVYRPRLSQKLIS